MDHDSKWGDLKLKKELRGYRKGLAPNREEDSSQEAGKNTGSRTQPCLICSPQVAEDLEFNAHDLVVALIDYEMARLLDVPRSILSRCAKRFFGALEIK